MAHDKNWKRERGGRAELEVHEGGKTRDDPASEEAELGLLGCIMLEDTGSETLARCLQERISARAFYWPKNQILFDLLVELHRRGLPMSLEVVTMELTSRKQLDVVGGFNGLAEITRAAPTSLHRKYFIAKVKEKWILRDLIRDANDAVEQCHAFTGAEGDNGLEDLIAPLASRFNRATEYARAGQESMQTRADQGYERILLKLDGKQDKSRQLLTGMKEFDQRFGAFDVLEEEWLIGVAALPSVGKSALTRKWADNFLAAGKKGIVFPFETGITKWLELSTATACRINARNLETLPKDIAAKFKLLLEQRKKWIGERLWIFDETMKAETLCARVEDHVRQHGMVDFVIVDHLHELYSAQTKMFRGQREQELAYIAKLLKKTAKRLNIPFFVPTQLNRSPAKDGTSRRPTMQDIRGSGEIEAAYDRLLMIHVPKEDMRGSEQTDNQSRVMIEIIQAKSRNGPKGHREFWFDRPFTDYVEIRDHEFQRAPNTPGGTAAPGGYGR
jgi:replicative DNA helicase